MAERKVFIAEKNGVCEEIVNFRYFSGFALVQKRKSIAELHDAIRKKYGKPALEISSKSPDELGIRLSAFNLKIEIDGKPYPIENIFQASKVFEKGGPYFDLLSVQPYKAKKDERLKNSGRLIGFRFRSKEFPLSPVNLFYDWLYCRALSMNGELAKALLEYDIFTDIEFNHNKSFNCQAHAAAVFVSLYKRGLLEEAMSSIDAFKNTAYSDKAVQSSIFDCKNT